MGMDISSGVERVSETDFDKSIRIMMPNQELKFRSELRFACLGKGVLFVTGYVKINPMLFVSPGKAGCAGHEFF
jgi:hypothetical protein